MKAHLVFQAIIGTIGGFILSGLHRCFIGKQFFNGNIFDFIAMFIFVFFFVYVFCLIFEKIFERLTKK